MVIRYISTKWNNAVRRFWWGLDEAPELYGSTFLLIVGFGKMFHWYYTEPDGGFILRYRDRYQVMRPDDPKLIGYPKEYVTDNHLLKD